MTGAGAEAAVAGDGNGGVEAGLVVAGQRCRGGDRDSVERLQLPRDGRRFIVGVRGEGSVVSTGRPLVQVILLRVERRQGEIGLTPLGRQ